MAAYFHKYEDFRKALLAVRNSHICDIVDMVRACQNVGTAAHNANSLAAALTAHLRILDTWGGMFQTQFGGSF